MSSDLLKKACKKAGLAAAVDAALVGSIAAAPWKNRREPRLVWELFCSPAAVAQWSKSLNLLKSHGADVDYDSVFVHQKPYVQFTPKWKRSCELGDVLFVASEWDPSAKPTPALVRRRALLLQAKVDDWPPDASHPQYQLFSKWPTFRFKSTKFRLTHPPAHRAFSGKAPHERAQYLVIDRTAPELSVRMANVAGKSAPSVGETLVELLSGGIKSKIANANADPKHSHWSRTVWDVLTSVADAWAPQKQVGAKAARGAGTGVLALTAETYSFTSFLHTFFCGTCQHHGPPGRPREPLPPTGEEQPPTGPGFSVVWFNVVAPQRDGQD